MNKQGEKRMKAKEYMYPNVVSFFLILSPLIYNLINIILFAINPNFGQDSSADASSVAALAGMITANYMYFFGIICASFMVLFGNRNKYLYPMGITTAFVTTAASFFNMMCVAITTHNVLYSLYSLLQIIVCIVMFISIVLTLHNNKNAEMIANISSIAFIVLIIVMEIGKINIKVPGILGYSLINQIA